jgi:hypothetical protein
VREQVNRVVMVVVECWQMEKKTNSEFFFGHSIWAQLLTPMGLSLEVVGGEGMGCGVIVVVGWTLCSVDTAKTK